MSHQKFKINVIIVGAGTAGKLLAQDIANHDDSGFNIIGFVDDSKAKKGKDISGFKVLGTLKDLKDLIKEHSVEELIIALPSERGRVVRDIVESTMGLRLGYKILPRSSEVLLQDYADGYLQYVREVQAEDLLGGEINKSEQAEISDFAEHQTVMITGAAGSIGSELSRQIVAHGAQKVILFDWWENGIFDLRNQIVSNYPDVDVSFIIGDVKDYNRVNAIMEKFQPTTVFHAAAYKHVPLMEENASEAVRNNIFGTKIVAEAAVRHGVQKFVLVSTDKAVNPTNIMGATKRAAEKIVHILAASQSATTFCAVRFGNVINSNGSAIPFFEKQIAQGGPVTLTHRDITRFFMTIPEAVHLILKAWIMGENDDLFVLDMGESIKIYDLVRLLIATHGYTPDEDIGIKIIGLRPGEKLYEEVLVKSEEVQATSVDRVFRTKNYMNFDVDKFLERLSILDELVNNAYSEPLPIHDHMLQLISTFKQNQK
ncbi:MAG: nucleoside-diphosphate sugar epimerase/dehydratase [Candidatus Microsaccharimonas sp.]